MQVRRIRNRVVLEDLEDREDRLVVRLEGEQLGQQFVTGGGRLVNVVDRAGRLATIHATSVEAGNVLRQVLAALMVEDWR